MTSSLDAFACLRQLLCETSPPPGLNPIQLHLGELRMGVPADHFLSIGDIDSWTRYPPLGGTADLRTAYTDWLERRFGVRQRLQDKTISVEPTPGIKQAVAAAIAIAVVRARARGIEKPTIVLPNPFYPTYCAGTEAAGANAVFYTLADGNDVSAIIAAARKAQNRVAAIIVCNPGSPRGEILTPETLCEAGTAASIDQATLIIDECYIDLSLRTIPQGYLSLVEQGAVAPGPFLVMHSLSKRSGAPGLRSGFVAGDSATVAAYAEYNRVCGVSTPFPVCAVAASLWADDTHVEQLRSSLARNWELADAIMGDVPQYQRAEAGFFLWLPVSDDEVAARQLWQYHALSVMPGRYLAAEDAMGVNPGLRHLRLALVHDQDTTREALTRLKRAMADR